MAQGNRIYVNTATVGQGTLTLGTVKSAQFCTFAEAGFTDGQEADSYIIEEGTDFEIVRGIYNSAGPTLTRVTVLLSRIGGTAGTTKMTLAGAATVRSIAAVENLVTKDASGNVAITGTLKIGAGAGTNTEEIMVNTASGTAPGIQLLQDGVASWIIKNLASSTTLDFSESGTSRMTLTTGGFLTVVDFATGLATAAQLRLDTGTKTATAVAGAATLNKNAGVITTESLTTAAGSNYVLTLTNSQIAAADQVFASVQAGTDTGSGHVIGAVVPGAGQVIIVLKNLSAATAFNGTFKISFLVLKN